MTLDDRTRAAFATCSASGWAVVAVVWYPGSSLVAGFEVIGHEPPIPYALVEGAEERHAAALAGDSEEAGEP